MQKIPTLAIRDEATRKVTDEITPGCEWVFDSVAIATEKLDGTNCKLVVERGLLYSVWKRQTPKGGPPGYVRCFDDNPEDQWIMDAARNTLVKGWPVGQYPCEVIGPKIQGNPLGLGTRRCVRLDLELPMTVENMRHRLMVLRDVPRDFKGLREYVLGLDSVYSPGHPAEGIVFHGVDGLAKIKRKDFGR